MNLLADWNDEDFELDIEATRQHYWRPGGADRRSAVSLTLLVIDFELILNIYFDISEFMRRIEKRLKTFILPKRAPNEILLISDTVGSADALWCHAL